MAKSIFRNTIFKALLNLCNIMIPVLVGPYITRVLDKEVFGLYNATNASFQIFLIVGAFGLYNYGMREISKVRDNKVQMEKRFSELLLLSFIANLLVSAVYIGFALLTTSGTVTMLYMLFAIQFIGNAVYIEWINEAMENYSFITIKTISIRLLYVAAMFLFVRKGSDILPYTLIMSLTFTLNCVVSFGYICRKVKIRFHKLDLMQHIRPLFVVFIIMNVNLLYTQIDKIMLGHFLNDVAVSIYQIPHYIMGMINAVTMAVAAVAVPRLSHVLHNQGKQKFFDLHDTVSRSYLFLFFPACIGVMAMAKEIILLYGSDKYIECIVPLMLFSVVYIPSAYTYLFGDTFLYIYGREKILALLNFVGGLVNVTLNSICIWWGIFTPNTAVFTLFLAYLVLAVCEYLYIRRVLHIRYSIVNRNTLRYFSLSLLFFPIVFFVRLLGFGLVLSSAVSLALCGIVYAGALLLLKDVNMLFLMEKLTGMIKRMRHR